MHGQSISSACIVTVVFAVTAKVGGVAACAAVTLFGPFQLAAAFTRGRGWRGRRCHTSAVATFVFSEWGQHIALREGKQDGYWLTE